jgi:hypothetical protein
MLNLVLDALMLAPLAATAQWAVRLVIAVSESSLSSE